MKILQASAVRLGFNSSANAAALVKVNVHSAFYGGGIIFALSNSTTRRSCTGHVTTRRATGCGERVVSGDQAHHARRSALVLGEREYIECMLATDPACSSIALVDSLHFQLTLVFVAIVCVIGGIRGAHGIPAVSAVVMAVCGCV